MSNTVDFPHISKSPTTLLQNAARADGDRLKEVLIIGFTEDGEEVLYSTTVDVGFLASAQLSVQNLAIHAMRGEVSYE